MNIRLQRFIPLLLALAVIGTLYAFGWHAPQASDLVVVGIGAIRPFPMNPQMSAIAIAYRNPDVALIADMVLPRTPTAQEFKYLKYDLAAGFTVPDARVGRKSLPTEVDFSATEILDKVVDYGLDDIVPNEDIEADNQGVDPMGTAVAYLTNLVNLAREQRVANLVFNTASYSAGLYTTLSGTNQWSDTANSDPVAAIGDALDVPIMRPNIAVFGQQTWTKLRRHPKIVQAIKNTNQGAGMVSREEFAEFFELQEVLVGQGLANTAKKGQTAALSRVWGKHASFFYRDRAAGPQQGVTFGMTAAWGNKIAGNIDEPKIGLSGSQRVRSGERVKEIITAPDVGYFFQNAVA
jgi:hypothetical protein